VLAKLSKSKVGFARNHGTMPPSGGGVFGFVTVGLAKFSKKQLCQSKCFVHRAKLTNHSSRIATLPFLQIGWACGGTLTL
jgi:hypothetical protein